MMRAYNNKIIPKIEKITDVYYMNDLEKISPKFYLNDKQIRQLIEEHRGKNDLFLISQMVAHFGRYVISIAKNYQSQGLSLGDLISEGMLGLIKSTERFDLEQPTKFVTYSNTVISRYMREALDYTNNIVKLPKNIRNERMKTKELIKKMQMHGEDEVAILKCISNSNKCFYFNPEIYSKKSLSEKINVHMEIDMEDVLSEEMISPNYKLNELDIREEINSLLKEKLTPDEAEIIKIFFGIDKLYPTMSYKDIAKELNLSKVDVKTLKESAIQKLKDKDCIEILIQFKHI